MTAASPLHVLQMGPPPASVGGMAQVAELLARSETVRERGVAVITADSGGGRGKRGYPAFTAALWRVAALKFDVLHLHVASGGSVARKALLAALCRRRGLPYVVHLHGGGFEEFLRAGNPVLVRHARALFHGAARVVVLGSLWREVVVTLLGVPEAKVAVVPNGVERISGQEGIPRRNEIIFVGGVTRAKGVDVLLDALSGLEGEAAWDQWTVSLIGPTPDEEIVGRIAARRSAKPRVDVLGPMFGDDKNARLAQARIFVLPSRTEGLPLVLLEAMSAGLACVATDVGSTRDVLIDGVNGRLVPPGDVTNLRQALRSLVEDSDARESMAKAGHATWRDSFSASRMCAQMVDVWNAVAALSRP